MKVVTFLSPLILIFTGSGFSESSPSFPHETFKYSLKMGHSSRINSMKFFLMPNHHGLAGCLVSVVGKRERMAMWRGTKVAVYGALSPPSNWETISAWERERDNTKTTSVHIFSTTLRTY